MSNCPLRIETWRLRRSGNVVFPDQFPALVDPSIAEVFRDRLLAQFDDSIRTQQVVLQFEFPEIRREVDRSTRRHDLAQLIKQCHVILLDVPNHGRPFAVGKGRRVNHDQVEFRFTSRGPLGDKLNRVFPVELVLILGETIDAHVVPGPILVGVGPIDRTGRPGTPCGRINRKRSSVGKQVEK